MTDPDVQQQARELVMRLELGLRATDYAKREEQLFAALLAARQQGQRDGIELSLDAASDVPGDRGMRAAICSTIRALLASKPSAVASDSAGTPNDEKKEG